MSAGRWEAITEAQDARLDERVGWYAELPGATPRLAAAFRAAAIGTSLDSGRAVDDVATLYYEAARNIAHAERLDMHLPAFEGLSLAVQEHGEIPEFIIALAPGFVRELGILGRALLDGPRPLAELVARPLDALARLARKVFSRA